ncbi:MAG: hypothetical protein LBI71_01015 [Enterobacteriaceae bacterium]|jgi:hypothetical protein|nr:hypothetical protein [Enterobacteriaceae bacterium]
MISHGNRFSPQETVSQQDINIMNYGCSVRDFFREDLQSVSTHGYCLLPEWICQSMVESVYAANWQPLFYPVLPPEQADMILQADIQTMMAMLSHRPQPRAILFAHPLGYIDPGCLEFLREIQHNHNIHVFLDFSQGYGKKDCLQELRHVHAAYYSFNGNKLIHTGGALRFRLTNREHIPSFVRNTLAVFYAAAEEKFTALKEHLQSHFIEDDIHDISLYTSYQSSPYRTVLNWALCSPSMQALLKRQGLVQPLLAEPRQEKGYCSLNYHQWRKEVMLMFSSPRVEWSQ